MKRPKLVLFWRWRPRQDSNLHTRFRNQLESVQRVVLGRVPAVQESCRVWTVSLNPGSLRQLIPKGFPRRPRRLVLTQSIRRMKVGRSRDQFRLSLLLARVLVPVPRIWAFTRLNDAT